MQSNRVTALFLIALAISSFVLAACAPQAAAAPATEILTGAVTRAQVMAAPGWEGLKTDYVPDPAVAAAIEPAAGDLRVKLFLGTWCGDSQREVPNFFALMDAAGIQESQVEMLALDKTKQDAAGEAEKWDVQYVPTFVFLKDGQEIGRIVERPTDTLEADLARFLAGSEE